MSIQPRDPASLDYVALWEEGWVRRRREELISAFLAQLIDEDMKREALEARKRFEVVTPYHPENPHYGREKFTEQAKKLAEEMIENERKIYVDSRSDRDKALIAEIIRKANFLVYVRNDEGVAEKLKIFVEHGFRPDHKGDFYESDLMFVGDHDVERLNSIWALKQRLEEMKDFCQYYDDEIKALYDQAVQLVSLEVVRKGETPQEVPMKPVTKAEVVIERSVTKKKGKLKS